MEVLVPLLMVGVVLFEAVRLASIADHESLAGFDPRDR